MTISEREWSIWTRGRINDQREFGLYRQVGNGFEWLGKAWNGVDEYAAIFTREQVEKQEFDTMFIDVDAHAGESWQDKVQIILAKVGVPPSRMYVTGRGAHLFFDLVEPVKGVAAYKRVCAALVKKWGIDGLVDRHVVGDVRRVARLPMSKNSHGGWMTRIPVDAHLFPNPLYELELANHPETLTDEEPRKVKITIEAGDEVAEREFGPTVGAEHIFEESRYPGCIRMAINEMVTTGELNHTERLHLASFLIQNDEKQKMWNLLKDYAGDFNPSISEYQLNYLERRGNYPYRCSKVPVGICPYAANQRDCPYYPSISVYRAKMMEERRAG